MALSCGCDMKPGVPLTLEKIQAHYKHTFEALMFWEIMRRQGVPQDGRHLKLSQARIDCLKAIEELYPEALEE